MKQFEIWQADLNPPMGTEPGKIRPVIIVHTNYLNNISHPSTIICPMTTKIKEDAFPLRVKIRSTDSFMRDSEILIDQIRAIDNRRLVKYVGTLDEKTITSVKQGLGIVLDL